MISRLKKCLSVFLVFSLLICCNYSISAGTKLQQDQEQILKSQPMDSTNISTEQIYEEKQKEESSAKERKNETTSYYSILSINVIMYLIYKIIFHNLD